MSRETGVIVLGIWVLIVPYLGFPESWRMVFLFVGALALITLGFLLRSEAQSRPLSPGRSERSGGSFVESMPIEQSGMNSLN